MDAIHKITHLLTGQDIDQITLEDLDTKGMTTRTRGRGCAAKAKLNRAILAQSWGEIRRQCAYKCQRRGIAFRVVDPAYTSQTCAACGHVERANRKTQARFCCVECGHTNNADVNAAINILAAGHVASARGGDVRRPEPAATLATVAALVKREALAGVQLALL